MAPPPPPGGAATPLAATPPEGAKPEGGEGEKRLAVSVPERGITLGNMIVSPGVDFTVSHLSAGTSGSLTGLEWGLGARMGIGADFDFTVQPVILSDVTDTGEFNYESVAGQATYRFLNIKDTFELGGRVAFQFLLPSAEQGVIVTPSIPARLHIGKIASLDTGVSVSIAAPFKGGSTTVGMEVPATFLVDIIEPTVHVGVGTGFEIVDFNDAGHSITVPLQFLAGVAVPGKDGPILDIDPFFSFPFFAVPGAPSGADKIVSQFWQTGVAIEGYLYL